MEFLGRWSGTLAASEHSGMKNNLVILIITEAITLGQIPVLTIFVVGVAASYTYSDLSWEQSSGDSQINSYFGGLYGSWNNGCFYVDASLLGAFSDYHIITSYALGYDYRHATLLPMIAGEH